MSLKQFGVAAGVMKLLLVFVLIGGVVYIVLQVKKLFEGSEHVDDALDTAKDLIEDASDTALADVANAPAWLANLLRDSALEGSYTDTSKVLKDVYNAPTWAITGARDVIVDYTKDDTEKLVQLAKDVYNAPTWAITETRDWALDKIDGWW